MNADERRLKNQKLICVDLCSSAAQVVFSASRKGIISSVMNWRIIPVTLLLLFPFLTNGAGDAPLDRATLHGLKAVDIVIDQLDPSIEELGVTAATLEARLMARLAAAQIPVDRTAAEFIGFRITSVRGNRGPFALSLTIGIYQPVLLSRDHDVRTATQTWEVESILMADPKQVPAASCETADPLADRFAAA